MKSPPPDTGLPIPQEEESMEVNKPQATKEQTQSETEKDSGYSDSSSESVSSAETPPSATTSVTAGSSATSQTQATYTSIYILQNVVLKQPHIVLLQPPLRLHQKRASASSYLPILHSYPRIAPRLTPPSPAPNPTEEPAPKVCRQTTPQLLEVSLRSLALLRRTRETQRSIRELRAHARLYERAMQGAEGGWERLRKVMERSGAYRKIPPAIDVSRTEGEMNTDSDDSITTEDESTASEENPETQTEEAVTSPEKAVTSELTPLQGDTGETV